MCFWLLICLPTFQDNLFGSPAKTNQLRIVNFTQCVPILFGSILVKGGLPVKLSERSRYIVFNNYIFNADTLQGNLQTGVACWAIILTSKPMTLGFESWSRLNINLIRVLVVKMFVHCQILPFIGVEVKYEFRAKPIVV